jgi:translation initiation factor 4E
MWEDEGNKNGGKISVKLKKDYTTIIWEEMVLAMIGGVLSQLVKEEVSGVVVSIRKEYNILQVWFKNYNQNVITEIEYLINFLFRQTLKDLLQIPDGVELETKQFFRK